jgi:hypothetical protein
MYWLTAEMKAALLAALAKAAAHESSSELLTVLTVLTLNSSALIQHPNAGVPSSSQL